jgi:hypothetical protein
MSPSVRLGIRFGFAAAATVAVAMLSSDLLSLETYVPSASPSLLSVVMVIAAATFIWSSMTTAGIASVLAGIENVPAAYVFTAGVAFAVLTPVMGYISFQVSEEAVAIVAMLIWVVVWPVVSVVLLWRLSRPNKSLERTRAR